MQLRWTALAAATALTLVACTDQEPPVAPSVSAPPSLAVGQGRKTGGHIVKLRDRARPSAEFEALVESLGGTTVGSTVTGLAAVSGLTAEAANELELAPDVVAVFPDIEIRIEPSREATAAIDPIALRHDRSDFEQASLYERQWNMDVIRAPAAWRAGKLGSDAVRVAILDTGIDPTHPDIVGRVDPLLSRSFNNFDVPLIGTFFGARPPWIDLNGHGTHVANTVVSNGVGTAGITANTRVIAVKVLSVLGSGSLNGILVGLDYASSPAVNAHVINMSLGTFFSPIDFLGPTDPEDPDYDPDFDTIEEATAVFHELVGFFNDFLAAIKAAGSLVVVAAGNDATHMRLDDTRYDVFCESVPAVCVSATGPRRGVINGARAFEVGFSDLDEPSVFTNFGDAVDFAAPGGNYSLNGVGNLVSGGFVWQACSRTSVAFVPDDDAILEISDFRPDICATSPVPLWAGYVGTSQASPHVAGLAALLAAEVGNNRPDVLEQALRAGAEDLGPRGHDDFFGNGRIDVARTLGLGGKGHGGGHQERR